MSAPSYRFALHDERLRPDHLFRRQDPHGGFEQHRVAGAGEPAVVELIDAVAEAEDDVDDGVLPRHLAQPVARHELRLVSEIGEELQDLRRGPRHREEVEVLRLSVDSGVDPQGVGAADQVRNPGLLQRSQRPTVEPPDRFEIISHVLPRSGRRRSGTAGGRGSGGSAAEAPRCRRGRPSTCALPAIRSGSGRGRPP